RNRYSPKNSYSQSPSSTRPCLIAYNYELNFDFFLQRKSPRQKPDGPVFLVVGGENAADRAWLSNEGLPYVQLADQINASIYLLEHRFYGNSRPTENTSVHNLQYLNAKQAVEDIDKFVEEVNRREKFKTPKWITFGGSYSVKSCFQIFCLDKVLSIMSKTVSLLSTPNFRLSTKTALNKPLLIYKRELSFFLVNNPAPFLPL
ncbi:unnamed protein product, partial [Gongylonema pulchrum]|uniref:Serine carboxypeptidase S28 family protein n=1 Tax=Gongylonema pulchrum TaxID=637853 RepID=A0A183CVX3_9BILA